MAQIAKSMHIVSFDIGATKTAFAVMNFEGTFLERPTVLEPTPQDYKTAMGHFRDALNDLYSRYDIRFIAGGAPGLDGNSGQFVRKLSNLPLWGGHSLKGGLESVVNDILRKTNGRYPMLTIRSDSYMAAAGASLAKLAETEDPRSIFPLLSIIQGTGNAAEESEQNGNGFRIYVNPNGKNREAGHNQFSGTAPNSDDIVCGHCPRPNCAETYLGGKHMKKRYGFEPRYVTPEMKGNVADNLAKFVATTKWQYEPRTVLLLGGIPNHWEGYVELVRRRFPNYQQNDGPMPEIEPSALGNNAALIGAWAETRRVFEGVWPKFDLRKYIEAQAVLYKN